MLGSIFNCFEELIKEEYSEQTWNTILTKAGQGTATRMFAHRPYDDGVFHKIYETACQELNSDKYQLAEAFGKAWMKYASKHYFAFFVARSSAKEFILAMDRTHTKITDKVDNATPPRFHYETIDDQTITMTYDSPRNLGFLMVGLLKAVGDFFNEKITVETLDENTARVTFHTYDGA
ncbi:hypothetical protein BKI52_03025 [marine bacterium AO1-C]|nr:hypothetical protein BKI52_03025 [marine bacterium AO1-C]